VTVAANQAAIQTTSLAPCNYSIIGSYTGDVYDQASSGGGQFVVNPPRSSVAISYTGVTTDEYGHPAALAATVTDNSGSPLSGRTVTFSLGTQSCVAVTDASGNAACSITATQNVPGPGSLVVSVPRDVATEGGSKTVGFTVTPVPTALSISAAVGPTTTTLTGRLVNDLTAPVASQPVTLTLGGVSCTATTDASGVATCTVATPSQASAILTGSFAGGTNYGASAAAQETVQISLGSTLTYTGATTAVYNAPATLSATLLRGGVAISGRTVTLALGSQTCAATTSASGVASCALAHVTQDSGAYTVTASFAGDSATSSSTASTAFTVTAAPTITSAATPTVGATSTALSATLTTGGTALPGKPLTLTLGTNSCTATTNATGIATCSVATPSGASATYTAKFAGDVDYTTSTDSKTVTLATQAPTTIVAGSPTSFFLLGTTLSGTLTSNGAPLAGKPVVLTFTYGDYTTSCADTTNADGKASCVVWAILLPGAKVVASFAGDSGYASSNSAQSSAPPSSPTLRYTGATNGDYHDSTTLSGTLTDSTGRPVSGQTVQFTVGTQRCSDTTDRSGNASCSLVLTQQPGPTTVVASTSTAASVTNPFSVMREETTLISKVGAVVVVDGSISLGAQLIDDGNTPISGRTVTLTLGNSSCTDSTDSSGMASCTVPRTSTYGPVTFKATFAGDTYFEASTTTSTVTLCAFADGGSFVVDGNHHTGDKVTWWGSNWSSANNWNGSSFHGWVSGSFGGTCRGHDWSASGNGTPPRSVPTYMAVMGSDSSRSSGSRYAGDADHIIVIKTDSGFSPSSGHAGTGTIVAIF
jgi:hypothetical protein